MVWGASLPRAVASPTSIPQIQTRLCPGSCAVHLPCHSFTNALHTTLLLISEGLGQREGDPSPAGSDRSRNTGGISGTLGGGHGASCSHVSSLPSHCPATDIACFPRFGCLPPGVGGVRWGSKKERVSSSGVCG